MTNTDFLKILDLHVSDSDVFIVKICGGGVFLLIEDVNYTSISV